MKLKTFNEHIENKEVSNIVDTETIMEDCCDSLDINNEYIGKVFQWIEDNDYKVIKK